MAIDVPKDSQCLSCGYLLRDLSEPVCPECARAFDPNDPTSFNVDPRRRRRRRLKRATMLVVGVGLFALVFWPRSISTALIIFTDKASGASIVVKRWEPLSPRWVPFRYPGWRWTSGAPGQSIDVGNPSSFTVAAEVDLVAGYSVSVTGSGQGENLLTINEIPATPENAPRLIKMLQAPDNERLHTDVVAPADLPVPP